MSVLHIVLIFSSFSLFVSSFLYLQFLETGPLSVCAQPLGAHFPSRLLGKGTAVSPSAEGVFSWS